MKISCKNEFNSLVSSLCALLREEGVSIRTSRAQKLLAHAFGYTSANGLLGNMPVELKVTTQVISRLSELLKTRHGVDTIAPSWLLRMLERDFMSLSTREGLDKDCYPSKLPDHTNYWYLTDKGWVPWSQMDFTKLRVEVGIYKVVTSYASPPLEEGEMPFICLARPIWTADMARGEFEDEAEKLERKYGEMPETSRMYPEVRDAL
ncbi:hypothetical protein [Halomonas maura]|uniref:hypothetical protein n=1 Tax=Halomonas maura TaxID=117606 RepID=UPI0025B5B3EF|nr:hypothetical protein [Halomonas maura]MDN3554698.1 hypothetical protein [Halomonas maura]